MEKYFINSSFVKKLCLKYPNKPHINAKIVPKYFLFNVKN